MYGGMLYKKGGISNRELKVSRPSETLIYSMNCISNRELKDSRVDIDEKVMVVMHLK